MTHLPKSLTTEQRQQNFFNPQNNSINPSKFDIIRGHLLGKGIDETAVDNLTVAVLEVAGNQNIDVAELINLLDTEDNTKLNTMLSVLLNTNRNRTSIVGYKVPPNIPPIVRRTILA